MGHKWETLTLTKRGLENGHPELFFGRYLDSDVKDHPSRVWYNWTDSFTSVLKLRAKSLIGLLR